MLLSRVFFLLAPAPVIQFFFNDTLPSSQERIRFQGFFLFILIKKDAQKLHTGRQPSILLFYSLLEIKINVNKT